MGAAVGSALASAGHTVLWASDHRSHEAAVRAREHGLADAGTLADLAARSDVVLSLCPPHAALEVARSFWGSRGSSWTRTLSRRTELWKGNRETIRNAILIRDNLFSWAVRSHMRKRRELPAI